MLLAGIFPASEPGSTVNHMTTVLLAGIFPVEVLATPETLFSFLYIFAILGSLFSLSLAAILLSQCFKQDENWHPIHRLAFLLAVLMLVSSSLFFLRPHVTIIYMGTVVGLLWLLLVAVRLQFIVVRPIVK